MSKEAKIRRALLAARRKAKSVLQKVTQVAVAPRTNERPWEQFVPKYREGEPVPGSLHSAIEEQRQKTEGYMARSAAFQRFTGRTTHGW
jgi:hypothetical protein